MCVCTGVRVCNENQMQSSNSVLDSEEIRIHHYSESSPEGPGKLSWASCVLRKPGLRTRLRPCLGGCHASLRGRGTYLPNSNFMIIIIMFSYLKKVF